MGGNLATKTNGILEPCQHAIAMQSQSASGVCSTAVCMDDEDPRGPRGGKGCKNRSGHVGVRGDGRRGDVSRSKALSRFRGRGWGRGLSPEFPASIHLVMWIKATSALRGDAPQFGPKYPLSFSTHPSPACFFSMWARHQAPQQLDQLVCSEAG